MEPPKTDAGWTKICKLVRNKACAGQQSNQTMDHDDGTLWPFKSHQQFSNLVCQYLVYWFSHEVQRREGRVGVSRCSKLYNSVMSSLHSPPQYITHQLNSEEGYYASNFGDHHYLFHLPMTAPQKHQGIGFSHLGFLFWQAKFCVNRTSWLSFE